MLPISIQRTCGFGSTGASVVCKHEIELLVYQLLLYFDFVVYNIIMCQCTHPQLCTLEFAALSLNFDHFITFGLP